MNSTQTLAALRQLHALLDRAGDLLLAARAKHEAAMAVRPTL